MIQEVFILKIKKLYEKLLLLVYKIIKNRIFQKIFLILTLISSILTPNSSASFEIPSK